MISEETEDGANKNEGKKIQRADTKEAI